MTREDLMQIRELMNEVIDEKLEPIKEDIAEMKEEIAEMKEDISEIKEDTKITRAATNEIIKWIEVNADEKSNPFPVDRKIV